MRKVTILVSIICLFVVLGFGQEAETADWQIYSSQSEEIQFQFPKRPKESVFDLKDADGNKKFISAKYNIFFNGTYYYIFSDSLKDSDNSTSNTVANFIAQHTQTYKKVKVDKFEGKQYIFSDSEEYNHKIIFVNAKTRSYIIHVFSSNELNLETEKIFNSINFKKPITLTKPKKSTAENKPKNVKELIEKGSGSGQGYGRGSGTGSGSGQESGSGNSSNAQINSDEIPKTRDLRILSKPKPGYTELARIYEISGLVRLRLTFSANGIIGFVSTVTRLPMGLTNQAINAAKGIRFEPKVVDGVPQTVAKMVEYSFTIY